jgi:hypothetical protein
LKIHTLFFTNNNKRLQIPVLNSNKAARHPPESATQRPRGAFRAAAKTTTKTCSWALLGIRQLGRALSRMAATGAVAPAALRGIKVLDLSRVLAGPLCCMLLGDWGADVVKVPPAPAPRLV